MKLWVAAAPLVFLAVWAGVRALQGQLSRRAANVAVALVLLLYVVTTAALGVFWVARMDLPVFDWHYLFGYGLLIVLAVHVGLQLASLSAHFRRASPAWLLAAGGRRFRWPVRALATSVLLAVVLAPVLAWVLGRMMPAVRVLSGRPPAGQDPTGPAGVWIERGGARTSVAEFLWSESRHTRSGVLRRPALTPPRPPPVRSAGTVKPFVLPQPRTPTPVDRGDAGARIVVGPGSLGVTLGTLSALLHHTYGVTRRSSDDLSLRAAASAGALYPTDVFVIARANSEIPAGVHYYDAEAHALSPVGGTDAVESVLAALPRISPLQSAPLLIVLGATFDRTVFKYDTRSYRYVGLDAGHVAQNLVVTADALGSPCVLEPRFDDAALALAVGLERDGEGALLVAGCGFQGSPSASSESPGHTPIELPVSADDVELTRLSHALTSWRLAEAKAPLMARDAGTAPLARPPFGHPDPLALIRQRRSYRSFAPGAAARSDLDAALRAATTAVGALGRPRLVDTFVSVRAVDGLSAGSYRFTEELAPVRVEPEIAARLQQAGLEQEVLGRAAFVVAFTLADTVGQVDGARDFRHALLQAGLAGQALYLEATARSLGACGVGAFFDDEVGELLQYAGVRPRALHLVAVGRK